ncbi:MAG TPA: 4-alpha-glucanotransferase [Polyangiaceae bacterium]|nr:4-alpha-glucanotransferase [Polyangiaceae bacterium]
MHPSPFEERSSGILLHPSSLPGPHGSGDLGPSAHRFAEYLARGGQRWWQMLPVGPLGGGNSPYDSPSSLAGNPLLINLELLVSDGLLEPRELVAPRRLQEAKRCLFPSTRRFRMQRLRVAFGRFKQGAASELVGELCAFREREQAWLPGFALFSALKRANGGRSWTEWEPDLALRRPAALQQAAKTLADEVAFEEFTQWLFDRQWSALRRHCDKLGVRLLGDVPMFVAHDGADVWEHRDIFQLDEQGHRRVVAGVPPDYFSAEGQRWGNPLYDWAALQRRGYDWWIARMKGTLSRFDAVRLDHFIAFHRYWEIPASAASAREGRFVLAPGADFFEKLRSALGGLPFVAEDLGLVTPEVQELRDDFELPGMRVLQFAFGGDSREYQPHRYPRRMVVYTGTHDNDTTVGWLHGAERCRDPEERERLELERQRALSYAGSDGREPHWDFIRLALASTANTALFPLQDLLGQGTEARINVPGSGSGNWDYRCSAEELSFDVCDRLRALAETYERIPNGLGSV